MLRLVLMLPMVVLALLPAGAAAKETWIPLGTAKIDPKVAGSQTFVLGEAKGGFRSLQLKVDGPVQTSRIAVQPANKTLAISVAQGTRIEPNKPLVIWSSETGRVIASVGMTWTALPASGTPVTITLEGLQDDTEKSLKIADETVAVPKSIGAAVPATADQSRGTGGGRGVGAVPPPPPESRPGTRGIIGASPPPPAPGAPAPASAPRPRTSDRESTIGSPAPVPRGLSAPAPAGGAADPGSICLTNGVCTPVPVFFGSSRDQVTGGSYVSFGYGRPDKLTLGRTIVTVPKARQRGEIARPTTLEWLRGVPPEGLPDRHFTIPRSGVKIYDSEAAFLAEAKKHIAEAGDTKDHAFIYVHGFAVSFENAMYRAAQITYDLGAEGKPFGTAFVYTWPSKGSILPTAYVYDGDSAEYAVPHFRKFVELVTQKTGVKNVHVIAHSMGNRVLMRALDEAVREGSPAWINQVILAAPDVDKQQFERLAKSISGAARGLTLYASQQDNALRISRTIRGSGAPPRAGEVAPPAGPAVVTGVDTIDISALSTAYFLPDLDSHDRYADSPEMLSDISSIFTKSKPPPEARNSKFRKATFGALEYWRYAK